MSMTLKEIIQDSHSEIIQALDSEIIHYMRDALISKGLKGLTTKPDRKYFKQVWAEILDRMHYLGLSDIIIEFYDDLCNKSANGNSINEFYDNLYGGKFSLLKDVILDNESFTEEDLFNTFITVYDIDNFEPNNLEGYMHLNKIKENLEKWENAQLNKSV